MVAYFYFSIDILLEGFFIWSLIRNSLCATFDEIDDYNIIQICSTKASEERTVFALSYDKRHWEFELEHIARHSLTEKMQYNL